MSSSRRRVKFITAAPLASLLLILAACGGSSSTSTPSSGALTGNWQVNLTQDFPLPVTQLSVSGFVVESGNTLTGSVQVPTVGTLTHCGGVSTLNGSISSQTVTFSVNEGGTLVNFTGTLDSDGASMTGSYQAVGGACFPGTSTTGTWSSFLVPPLNGNFTGTLDSSYMATLTGASGPVPVTVSGTMTQSSNAGASNATLTGTISAVNYPCFTTATLTGTISGQNVYLDIFDYNGAQIGIVGIPSGQANNPGSPATVVIGSTGLSLVDDNLDAALILGVNTSVSATGPCPALAASPLPIVGDFANVTLDFQ